MENLTHSLLGAALAELALPADAPRSRRRLFFVSGIVAANLPDADLLYTRITPPPLGYLLHHRGHTHTIAGVIAQALLIGIVCCLPAIRRHVGPSHARLWTLIGVSMFGHLLLDSWNSYGVHPFWPLDVRWYYGDAIYILEPWLWLLLGVAAAMNTRHAPGRLALGAGLGALTVALVVLDMIPIGSLVALFMGAALLTAVMRAWTPRARSGLALALLALFVTSMFGVRQRVHARVLAAMSVEPRGRIIDVVLSPNAANPLCWSALTVMVDEQAGEYVTTRGTAAAFGSPGCGSGRRSHVEWNVAARQPLTLLRDRVRRDCSVRAWMQFGRAPELGTRTIGDFRYGGATHDNFSTLRLEADERTWACPPNLTRWAMPRADLLDAEPGS